jgi:hypothetical protein
MRTLKALHIAEELFGASTLEGEELKKALLEIFESDTYEGSTPEEMAEAAMESILFQRLENKEEER